MADHNSSLPAALKSTGDPRPNPFRPDDSRHGVWEDATRDAEKNAARLNAAFAEAPPTNAADFVNWAIELHARRFDIWAERSIHVVWGSDMLPIVDQWNFEDAEALLEAFGNMEVFGRLHQHDRAAVVSTFRLRLVGRLEYWKAEVRRYLQEQARPAAQRAASPQRGALPDDHGQSESAEHAKALRKARAGKPLGYRDVMAITGLSRSVVYERFPRTGTPKKFIPQPVLAWFDGREDATP